MIFLGDLGAVGPSSGGCCSGTPYWPERRKVWIRYFKELASLVSTKSKDQNTKIGAVLVGPDNSIVSTGYNSFPRGINDDVPERQERPEKYFWFEHAERNAIYNAARNGVSTIGTTMYLNCRVSCPDCARGIINSGVKEVWFNADHGAKGEHFKEGYARSLTMLAEAGVTTHFYDEIDE